MLRKTALLFGAQGLTGKYLLDELDKLGLSTEIQAQEVIVHSS